MKLGGHACDWLSPEKCMETSNKKNFYKIWSDLGVTIDEAIKSKETSSGYYDIIYNYKNTYYFNILL